MYNITNETAIDKILINIAQNVPSVFPLLLFFEFLVIGLGGALANKQNSGFTNIPMWFSIAGLVTTTSAFLLFLVGDLINLATLGIVVAITLGCVFWFMMQGDD